MAVANATPPYGLPASIFIRDLSGAFRFVKDGRAGIVRVTLKSAGLEFEAPFGGMTESSGGSCEQGKVAVDFFTPRKTVYIDRAD
ncbi:MAG TPA: aldehyde dehydrogenase family protein [Chloroflexota bacterium]|nr:aldehyde dehydrogenase family protein [Chloroflexota bacterium]